MTDNKPLVSIGLPVYNGERYVGQALDSILAQTFRDFELIISDNASTDRTEEICRSYAAKNSATRYVRNEKNLGAAKNFNQALELARGRYFRWVAADDLIAPECLERCVDVLEHNPDVLIAHTKLHIIDENSNHLSDYDDLLNFRSPIPHVRFRDYLFRRSSMWNAIYALIRTDVLRKTQLLRGYRSSDQVLLGELVLRGKIFQIPEHLFSRRRHPQQSWQAHRSTRALAMWFDPTTRHRLVLPWRWKVFLEYFRTVHYLPLERHEKLWCYAYLMKWGAKQLGWRPVKRGIARIWPRLVRFE